MIRPTNDSAAPRRPRTTRAALRLFVPALLSSWALFTFAQITLPTAMPVGAGEGIVRAQSQLVQSTDDPTDRDRELTVKAFPVTVAYGVTPQIALFGTVPIVDKRLEVNTPSGRVARRTSGPGDASLMARYAIYQRDRPARTFRFAPFVVLNLPIGDDSDADELGALPRPLQAGSGSWDASFGAVTTLQRLKWQADASVSRRFQTEARDFQFGDVTRFDAAYKVRVWPRRLSGGVPGFVYVALESNLVHRGQNRDDGAADSSSGGTTWHLNPGVQYIAKRYVAEAAIRIPAVQKLNGNALGNDFASTLSLRANF